MSMVIGLVGNPSWLEFFYCFFIFYFFVSCLNIFFFLEFFRVCFLYSQSWPHDHCRKLWRLKLVGFVFLHHLFYFIFNFIFQHLFSRELVIMFFFSLSFLWGYLNLIPIIARLAGYLWLILKKKQFFGFSYNYFFKLHALTFFLLRILLYCFLGLHSMQ
jgi:hypothetical protein